MKPYFSAIFVATSGSTRWLMEARTLSAIKSAMSLLGLMSSFAARSFTTTAPLIEISRDCSLTEMRPDGWTGLWAAEPNFFWLFSKAMRLSLPFLLRGVSEMFTALSCEAMATFSESDILLLVSTWFCWLLCSNSVRTRLFSSISSALRRFSESICST